MCNIQTCEKYQNISLDLIQKSNQKANSRLLSKWLFWPFSYTFNGNFFSYTDIVESANLLQLVQNHEGNPSLLVIL